MCTYICVWIFWGDLFSLCCMCIADCNYTQQAQIQVQAPLTLFPTTLWVLGYKLLSPPPPSQHLREAMRVEAAVAGQDICSQVRGPPLLESLCGQLGKRLNHLKLPLCGRLRVASSARPPQAP